ncbi:helix-turn-helix domain-containing protein [Pararoseomonas sp. SCSIO 73927]|uniref:helix-turn-helix domain-containing protein n=1 Tax=Pararoseomonas sp. SCSIO 73927 TaxID=3114537 RepID=UPI0030CE3580
MAANEAEGWHLEQIKAALRQRFGSLRALSLQWKLNRSAISNTLTDPTYSVRLEKRIAKALDQHPNTLWPDRWTPKGESRPRAVIAGKRNRAPAHPHRQKREAA